jgi:hypothetical protein
MGHAERIIAEIATLNEVEQASLLAYVEKSKAGRETAKAPNLTAAQARDRDALAAELAPFRVSFVDYKFDREETSRGMCSLASLGRGLG